MVDQAATHTHSAGVQQQAGAELQQAVGDASQRSATRHPQQPTVAATEQPTAGEVQTGEKRKRGRPKKTQDVGESQGATSAATTGNAGDGQSTSAAKRQTAAAARLERDIDAHLTKRKPEFIAEAVQKSQESWEDQRRDGIELLKTIRLERTDADIQTGDFPPSADGHIHFRIHVANWRAMREAVLDREILREKVAGLETELGQHRVMLAEERRRIDELTDSHQRFEERVLATLENLGNVGSVISTTSTANPASSIDPRLTAYSTQTSIGPSLHATSSHILPPSHAAPELAERKKTRKRADLNQTFLDDLRSVMGISRNDPLPDYPSNPENWPTFQDGTKKVRFTWKEKMDSPEIETFLGAFADKYTKDEEAKKLYGAVSMNREQVLRILKDQFRSKKKAYRRLKKMSDTERSAKESAARRRTRRDTRVKQVTPVAKQFGLLGEGWHGALKSSLALDEATTDGSSSGADSDADRDESGKRVEKVGRTVQQILPAWVSWELYQMWTLTFAKVDKKNHSTSVIKPTYRTVWEKPLPRGVQAWMVDGWWKERVMADAALRSNLGPFDGTGPACSSSEFGTSVRLPVRAADGSELPPDQDRLHNGPPAAGEQGPRYGPEASTCEPLKMGLDAWSRDPRSPCHAKASDIFASGYDADSEPHRAFGATVGRQDGNHDDSDDDRERSDNLFND